MNQSTNGPVEVILKSTKLQKQYNLDMEKHEKIKGIAAFLLTLK